jgi:hypothetical protein
MRPFEANEKARYGEYRTARLVLAPGRGRVGREVKQLGPADFVFPSATHSRFAHCVGVFHTARQLIEIINREIADIGETFNEQRADVAGSVSRMARGSSNLADGSKPAVGVANI